jgi:hypothetical protein
MTYNYKINKDEMYDVWQVIRESSESKEVILEEDDLEELATSIKELARYYKEDITTQIDSVKLSYLLEDIEDYE